MPSQTNEQALEASIEESLTGTSLEALKEQGHSAPISAEEQVPYRAGNGYYIGSPAHYNAQYALDEYHFWHFLESTQATELQKIQRQPDWKQRILDRYDRMAKKYGILRLLRKGLDIDDAHFTLLYTLPLASSSPSVRQRFEQNQFSVTRQVQYSQSNKREEIDMVLFVNGIPFASAELKNAWTGQNARLHGQNQYKHQRDIQQPLLQFGRCLVHFTIDTDEVYMTTRLNGSNTFFLPFNKGYQHGKGNPPNPFGHKSAYLWEEVMRRQSVANIVQHFMRFDGKSSDPLSKRTLFFPRYHQLDVVRKLVQHSASNGVGHSYLVQHSAGSGKSNSITWAAYQLIETYAERTGLPGGKSPEQPLFDSVIVVTDRRLLDKQLRENIKDFSEVKNIIAPAYSSADLKLALETGKRIIITTIQKFPHIVSGIDDLSQKSFAVLIDEAHSGQSGIAHGKMNEAMGSGSDEGLDGQDLILEAIKKRKTKNNVSYIAFTATPKAATLEKFGSPQADGSFAPFHLYSMKQAIEEGFILDVLANYTTLKSYYELQKSVEDNPLFDSTKAQKKLKAYVERHEDTIATKAEIMLDHFISHVVNKKKLKGKAKGMVATQSIESAIKYYQALQKLLEARGNPFKILIAFSGEKTLKGIKHSEEGMNHLPAELDKSKPTDPGYIADKLARYFDMDEYRLLVVANKYLTGFDQPKLSAMYVDKKLQGVLAVQALSRLNRSANKLDKKSEHLFVLDFFNTTDDIKAAFDPFYTATSLSSATDINVLHELKATLNESGVYEWSEVETFTTRYFAGVKADDLSYVLDVAQARFDHELELSDDAKADVKIKAKQFVKIYAQVSGILPFERLDWELLYWFLKFLIPKLAIADPKGDALDALLDSVDLSTYGLERTRLNSRIELDASEEVQDPQNPNPRGAHGGDSEEDSLEAIIQHFNERFFQGWEATPEEQRMKFITLQKRITDHPDFKPKVADNADLQNRDLALKKIIDEVMSKQRKADMDLYKLYVQDKSFYQAFFDTMKRMAGV